MTCSQSKWNPTTFLESLLLSNISVTSIVPTQLHDLVAVSAKPPSSLRLVLVGGGRIQVDLFKAALALGWPLCATYGMTEAASQVASQPLEHDRLNDPQTLEVLPHWHTQTNPQNRLTIQGPSLARGYVLVTDSQFFWEPIDPSIGLLTSDQVKLIDDGTRTFLQFLSRNDNVIKVLGVLVSIEFLEQRLSDKLSPCPPPFAIVPIPDARRENRLLLVIESPDSEPLSGLRNLLADFNSQIAPFEHIDEIKTLPSFPRTELGKLSRSHLADLLI